MWIYIVLLGAAALLYAVMLPKQGTSAASREQLVQEMEITLEQYMGEIQVENGQLLELVAQIKQEQSAKQTAQQEQLNEMRQRLLAAEQQIAASEQRLQAAEKVIAETTTALSSTAMTAATAAEEEPEPISSIKNRYTELFEMHKSGKSIDMIAKAVGMQRGEVQLIIQLAKQEETP